jgi:hypothetical protein
MIDAIFRAASHADDSTVFDGDVQAATVGTQHAGRLHPALNVALRDA